MEKEITIENLLELLSLHGGEIVCTASLDTNAIDNARATKRLYVDNNGIGFAWIPPLYRLPKTDEEVEFFEKWYPISPEMPDEFKTADFLFRPKENVYGMCVHGENMARCSICNPGQN